MSVNKQQFQGGILLINPLTNLPGHPWSILLKSLKEKPVNKMYQLCVQEGWSCVGEQT